MDKKYVCPICGNTRIILRPDKLSDHEFEEYCQKSYPCGLHECEGVMVVPPKEPNEVMQNVQQTPQAWINDILPPGLLANDV